MRIYLAGKIAGDPGYREKFQKAQARLERDGVAVLNPANNPEGLSKADYMRLSFAMIDAADEVTFLPDAAESPGAQLERRYCEYIGKPFSILNSPKEPAAPPDPEPPEDPKPKAPVHTPAPKPPMEKAEPEPPGEIRALVWLRPYPLRPLPQGIHRLPENADPAVYVPGMRKYHGPAGRHGRLRQL